MHFPELNYLAILVAGLAKFIIGGLWFSPLLFVKPWLAEMKFTEEVMAKAKAKGMAATLVPTFLMGLVQVFVLAIVLKAMKTDCFACAAGTGLMLGVGFAAVPAATNALFEQRSAKLVLITAGHDVTAIVVASLVLGAWPK